MLEAQWIKFQERVHKSKDFQEIRLIHEDQYLRALLDQCFLTTPSVLHTIHQVIFICKSLCRLIREMDEDSIRGEMFIEPFMKIKRNFERKSCDVFTQLSNFKNRSSNLASAPYLAQLLGRIDYNNFFSNLRENFELDQTKQELVRAG